MAACLPREETETKVTIILQAILGNDILLHYIFYLLEENPYSYSHTDLHEYHGTEIFGSHLQVCPLHNPNIYQR